MLKTNAPLEEINVKELSYDVKWLCLPAVLLSASGSPGNTRSILSAEIPMFRCCAASKMLNFVSHFKLDQLCWSSMSARLFTYIYFVEMHK